MIRFCLKHFVSNVSNEYDGGLRLSGIYFDFITGTTEDPGQFSHIYANILSLCLLMQKWQRIFSDGKRPTVPEPFPFLSFDKPEYPS